MKRSFAYAKRITYLLLSRRSQHSKIKRCVLFRCATFWKKGSLCTVRGLLHVLTYYRKTTQSADKHAVAVQYV